MPLLQVRDFPSDIYEQLSFEAHRRNRTIAQQTIVIIKKGLGETMSNKERRKLILDRIQERTVPEEAKKVDSVALIRKMREERTNHILAAVGDIKC
jgi:Fe-S cluster biosynthesis and repair protein YggX